MNNIKKYSGEIIRQAIATKLDKQTECCNFKIDGNLELGYNFGWDIYVTDKKTTLLKVSQEQILNSGISNYRFNFGMKQITSFDGKAALSSLFDKIDNEDNECLKAKSIQLIFAFRKDEQYSIIRWEPDRKKKVFSKFFGCSTDKTFSIILTNDEESNKFQLKFLPYGISENIELTECCSIILTNDDYVNAEKIVKERKYDTSDWQRLLDRSFEKYWKYELKGQENDQLNKTDEKKKYKIKFLKILPKNEFESKFFKNELRSCEYCGIKEDQLSDLCKQSKRSGRGVRLEYDRIKDDQDYRLENVVLACYWCNNAKTDEFSTNEFKEIARGINKTWNRRLANKKQQDGVEPLNEISKCYVEFPEYAVIWENNHDYRKENFCDKAKNYYCEEEIDC